MRHLSIITVLITGLLALHPALVQTDPAPQAISPAPVRLPPSALAGHVLTRALPVYPREAKKKHVSGAVIMRAIIGKDGTVRNFTIVSGPDLLIQAAIDTVSQWTYKPYFINGMPTEVDARAIVMFNFSGAPPVPPPAPEEDTDDAPPSGAPGHLRMSSGVAIGANVYKVDPVYPPEAKSHGTSGSVVLGAVIGKDGSVAHLDVVSGPDELRQSAMDAVSKWRYKPFLFKGQATEVDTAITANFTPGPGSR